MLRSRSQDLEPCITGQLHTTSGSQAEHAADDAELLDGIVAMAVGERYWRLFERDPQCLRGSLARRDDRLRCAMSQGAEGVVDFLADCKQRLGKFPKVCYRPLHHTLLRRCTSLAPHRRDRPRPMNPLRIAEKAIQNIKRIPIWHAPRVGVGGARAGG